MIYRTAGFIVFFLYCCTLSAQPLSAFVTQQNEIMVWDKGIIRKIDYLPPTDLKIGRTTIPYLDNSRSFKIYYGGGMRKINIGFTNSFETSDNLVIYLNGRSLNVFDRGTTKNLTGLCQQYFLGDSLVFFFDGVRNEYKAYYNGAIIPIENFLAGSAIDTSSLSNNIVKVSDNIAAYVNYANQFRIFWRGEIIAQEDYLVNGFGIGRNTVAYIDANREFKIFHGGKTIHAEDYPPQSFAVGDDLAAYVSTDGYYKIFYNDSIYKIGFFTPTAYDVRDNIVSWQEPGGYMKVFYKGEITTVDNYYPANLMIQYNSLAYINRSGTLRMFCEGEVYDVTNSQVDDWQLHYDVLQYRIGPSLYRIFYKGQEY